MTALPRTLKSVRVTNSELERMIQKSVEMSLSRALSKRISGDSGSNSTTMTKARVFLEHELAAAKVEASPVVKAAKQTATEITKAAARHGGVLPSMLLDTSGTIAGVDDSPIVKAAQRSAAEIEARFRGASR